jgi:hypothetical protein
MAARDWHCQGALSGIIAAGMAEKDEKAERLAAALRENLRKRKAQARGEPLAPAPPKADD